MTHAKAIELGFECYGMPKLCDALALKTEFHAMGWTGAIRPPDIPHVTLQAFLVESTNPNPAAYELIQALFCPPTYPAPASTDERHEAPAVMPTNWGKA